MNRSETNDFLAREVMDYYLVKGKGPYYWAEGSTAGELMFTLDDWVPMQDLHQAMQCLFQFRFWEMDCGAIRILPPPWLQDNTIQRDTSELLEVTFLHSLPFEKFEQLPSAISQLCVLAVGGKP